MKLVRHPEVDTVYRSYPKPVQKKLMYLRQLVLDTASEIEDIDELEETLKWGEPSYLAKKGSTIRIDWKEKSPDQYAMYFKCTSKLADTFKRLYSDVFTFAGDRAIVFSMTDKVPARELKHCIQLALTYHRIKHLPNLGT